MTEANAAFLQRIIAAAGGELIIDGLWGPQSQGALESFAEQVGAVGENGITTLWWTRLFADARGSFRSVGDVFDADVTLPDGAVLWRERADSEDPLFPREQQFILVTESSAADIASLIVSLNPDVTPLDFDDWPSWVIDAGIDTGSVEGSYDDIRVGDCFDFPTSQSPSARRVPCSLAHDGQMLHDSGIPNWMVDLQRYPNDSEFDDLYFDECVSRADDYRSDWSDDSSNLFIDMLVTIESDWSDEAGYSCVWTTYDGGPLTEFISSDSGIDPNVITDGPILVGSFALGGTVIGVIDKGPGRVDIAVATLAG